MSTSTDAILFYGYVWDEEDKPSPWTTGVDDDRDEEDWKTRYGRLKGIDPEDWRALDAIAETSPCLVDTHCMATCPMAYVAVRASLTISCRGFPSEILSLAVEPVWPEQLATFCQDLGIDVSGKKAAWWLVSYWSA